MRRSRKRGKPSPETSRRGKEKEAVERDGNKGRCLFSLELDAVLLSGKISGASTGRSRGITANF